MPSLTGRNTAESAPKTPITRTQAVIFDLDGVIVSTDEYHYQAWKRLADEEGIHFDHEINRRLRGVSRMRSLEILLERSPRRYPREQQQEMADRKNGYYRGLLQNVTPADLLAGSMALMTALKQLGIKVAVASSSKNSPSLLKRLGLATFFDAVVDGNDVTRSKPDPAVFLIAAQRLGVPPEHCMVVEDAEAGVEAALAAGMRVLGVGPASNDQRANLVASDLSKITAQRLIES